MLDRNILGAMDEDYFKECKNTVCSRHQLVIYTPMKKCANCNSKLKRVDLKRLKSLDPNDIKIEMPRSRELVETGRGPSREPVSIKGFVPRSDVRVIGKPSEDWSTGDDSCVTGCPVQKLSEVDIRIPVLMFNRWIWLAKMLDTEWMAYLTGKLVDATDTVPKHWLVESYYFPRQRGNPTHVEATHPAEDLKDGTIGAVHSHVGMGVFFSAEDTKHANHDVEIVINRRYEVETSVRIGLDCGRYSRTKAKRTLLIGADDDQTSLEELRSRLTQSNYSSYSHYSPSNTSTPPTTTGGLWNNNSGETKPDPTKAPTPSNGPGPTTTPSPTPANAGAEGAGPITDTARLMAQDGGSASSKPSPLSSSDNIDDEWDALRAFYEGYSC